MPDYWLDHIHLMSPEPARTAEFYEIEDATHGVLGFPAAARALREWVLRMVSRG